MYDFSALVAIVLVGAVIALILASTAFKPKKREEEDGEV